MLVVQFAMAPFMHVWFADMLVNGMAALAVCLMGYLVWMVFRDKRQRRKDQKQREHQRRGHWGYE